MVMPNSCILCLTWGLIGSRCSYHDDRYLSTVVPVDGSSGLRYPTHHKRFIVKMFTFVAQNTFTPQEDTVQSFTYLFLLFFSCFVIKWQSEVSMANEQLAIFFRSSSIVLRQCVIPAAQTLVNSHATGNVSSSSTVIHGFNVILLIILSPALIIGWSLKLWQSELLCKFQDSYTTLNSKRSVWILNWGENLPVIICRYKDVRGKM